VTAACDHLYCRPCLITLFEGAIADEERFPARCCGQTINVSADFLGLDIVQQYAQKKLEFETVDRTYCFSSACATFLKPENIQGDCGTCPACDIKTCKICKAAWHTGDCPADTNLQLLLETGMLYDIYTLLMFTDSKTSTARRMATMHFLQTNGRAQSWL
jgi:hypothetical protein